MEQSFPLSPRRRLFLALPALFFILLPVSMILFGMHIKDPALAWAGVVTAMIMVPFALFMIFWIYFPELVVSGESIRVRGTIGIATISVPWSLLESVNGIPGREGLVLNQPLDSSGVRMLRNFSGVRMQGVALYDDDQRRLMAECRFVPIEAFGWWFDHGVLLDAIRKHAPDAVTNFSAERERGRAEAAKGRGAVIWALVATGVLIVGTILFALYEPSLSPAWRSAATIAGVWLARIFGVLISVVMLIYAGVNVRAAWHFAKDRHFGSAVLWTCMAMIQLLLVLSVAGSQISHP